MAQIRIIIAVSVSCVDIHFNTSPNIPDVQINAKSFSMNGREKSVEALSLFAFQSESQTTGWKGILQVSSRPIRCFRSYFKHHLITLPSPFRSFLVKKPAPNDLIISLCLDVFHQPFASFHVQIWITSNLILIFLSLSTFSGAATTNATLQIHRHRELWTNQRGIQLHSSTISQVSSSNFFILNPRATRQTAKQFDLFEKNFNSSRPLWRADKYLSITSAHCCNCFSIKALIEFRTSPRA